MTLTLYRHWFTNHASLGILKVDATRQCFTLEDTARAPGVKLPKETAIPEGEYTVVLDHSARFNRLMPHILDVPNFTGVRIHMGNTVEDTEGCILVGYNMGHNTIWNSKKAFNDLFALLQVAVDKKEPITLQIMNVQL